MRKVCLSKKGFTLKRSANKGFTLIEMMISLGLILVITGITVPRFVGSNRLQKVVTTRDQIKLAYIQARDNALSGKNSCPAGEGYLGWRVIITGAFATGYTIAPAGVCSNGNYPTVSSTFAGSNITIPANTLNVNLSAVAGTVLSNGILFRAGGQGIYPPLRTLPVASNIITVTVSDNFGNSRTFTINGFGRIQ